MVLATAASMQLLPTRSRGDRFRPTALGAVLGLGVVLAVTVLPSALPSQRLRETPAAPTYCIDAGIRLCVFQEHRRHAERAEASLGQLVAAARARGYESLIPRGRVESSRTYVGSRPGIATVHLPFDPTSPRTELEFWADELTVPRHCRALFDGPPESYFEHKLQLELTWLRVAGAEMTDLPTWEAFHPDSRVLSPQETSSLMRDFAACRL